MLNCFGDNAQRFICVVPGILHVVTIVTCQNIQVPYNQKLTVVCTPNPDRITHGY